MSNERRQQIISKIPPGNQSRLLGGFTSILAPLKIVSVDQRLYVNIYSNFRDYHGCRFLTISSLTNKKCFCPLIRLHRIIRIDIETSAQ